MARYKRMLTAMLASFLLLAAFPEAAGAETQVCPEGCSYATIQEAVNSAAPNDTIVVQSDVYRDALIAGRPVVLQGMDTSGKDGSVRHVMRGVSPQSVRAVSFKKPTEIELAHDFLWRVHAQVPAAGEIAIFNRSHYEDVLVVRVHSLVPEPVWRKRYAQIRDFERMLAETGTTILKFFLHIGKEEQRERLEARIKDPTKRWKFQHGDLEERKLWGEYTKAYEDALEETSSGDAPWIIVPANKKWFRNYVVAKTIVETLDGLKMKYPAPDLRGERIDS